LSVAARLLGVSRPTLYGLLEAHGLGTEVMGSGDAAPITTAVTETTMQNE
jgi:two-component system, NtrC family, response regulator